MDGAAELVTHGWYSLLQGVAVQDGLNPALESAAVTLYASTAMR